ncbi:MAG: Rid family detoxifying hydrolase [Candidatus Kapaibacterium sp.]
MKKEIIYTESAPEPIGPYSQAVLCQLRGKTIYTSGQLGLYSDGTLSENVSDQTIMAMTNLKNVLNAAGCEMEHVVKTTIFLKDLNDFNQVNEIYAKFFTSDPPARSTIQVARLPKDALVEIEAFAIRVFSLID